jgi:potassium uptake TrkH family protein
MTPLSSPSGPSAVRGPAPTLKNRKPYPARDIFIGFAVVAALGTVALRLPMSTTDPGQASLSDAAFTAISALCVTGLSTVDPATHWTGFGHLIIAVLIQLGGFGVMSFATVLGLFVLRRMSLTSRLKTASEKNTELADMRRAIVGIIAVTTVVEVAVGLALFLRFWLHYGYSVERSLQLGAFHAVSAFNNAGFALFSDNLMSFVGDPFINLPISAAIIIGGLGFPVIMQLLRFGRLQRRWSMNTRLVLAGTVVFLIAGTVFITAVEWTNPKTLGGLTPAERLLAGFFQSVQTRTAGFNSVDIGALHPVTWLGMDVLMFIGGGPAGTAGGIKITTFGVLFFILLAELRGDTAVNVFGKRLSRSVHRQAISLVLLSIAFVIGATALLMLLTPYSLDRVLFEAISAFGTVGLSTGITASLSDPARLVVMLLMFVGRLGPITFATALALKPRHIDYELPKERPIIG